MRPAQLAACLSHTLRSGVQQSPASQLRPNASSSLSYCKWCECLSTRAKLKRWTSMLNLHWLTTTVAELAAAVRCLFAHPPRTRSSACRETPVERVPARESSRSQRQFKAVVRWTWQLLDGDVLCSNDALEALTTVTAAATHISTLFNLPPKKQHPAKAVPALWLTSCCRLSGSQG